ncbi:MAG: NAD(P)-dependent oxidoreductase [Clostridia bacterium]|nr:NAD(P)-dependent oxidoreductase [Clostridia bacterium]
MNIVLLESLGISEDVLESHVQSLRAAGHAFTAYPKTVDVEQLKREAKDADVLMLANMPLSGEVIRACTHLKYIDIAFTGVDHVDLVAAKELGVRASNASGYSNESVAELAVCMMLMLLRNVPQVDARCRAGQTKDGLVGVELRNKTVGLVGTGAIGQRTAALLRAFGCRVIAADTFGGRRPGKPDFIEYMPLNDMLAQADVVSLHCPLTDQSRNLIDAEAIARMKPNAILINVARGPVVNSAALARALNDGRIAGAGIDVFEVEPPLDGNHPLLHAKNCVVTPHVAFASVESMNLRADIVFENLNRFLQGEVINAVL